MRNIAGNRVFNMILLFTIIGEFIVPWILERFYSEYNGKIMVMSVLGSPQSPVRLVYNIWLIWLIENDFTQEEALMIAHKEIQHHARNMAEENAKLKKMPFTYGLFKMFAKSHMKKKYPIEGFTVEWKRNDSNEIHFDIVRCLYRDMCEKYCCPELCTVFCQSDITAFSGYEPKIRFERAGTLGEGADCCDFHFIHGSH